MAVNGDQIASLEGVIGARDDQIPAAEDGADADAGGESELAQRNGEGRAAGLEADLL